VGRTRERSSLLKEREISTHKKKSGGYHAATLQGGAVTLAYSLRETWEAAHTKARKKKPLKKDLKEGGGGGCALP